MENHKLLLKSNFIFFLLFFRLLKVLTKFVQSKILILEMLKFTLGVWHVPQIVVENLFFLMLDHQIAQELG